MTVEIVQFYEETGTVSSYASYQAKLYFKAWRTDDTDELLAAIAAAIGTTIPSTMGGVPLSKFDYEHLGGGVWSIPCEYTYQPSDTDPQFTFDTTGGTSHITQSLSTISKYAASGYGLPDFGGAIGVTKDSVDGTDIIVPVYRFSEEYFFDNAVVDQAFKLTVFALTGKVNDDTFRGLAAGECLFEGCRGTRRGNGRWGITFHFAGSPNVTGLSVGTITSIEKIGWDYLWVRYHEFSDNTFGGLVKRPVAVVVDRVYNQDDLTLLGI